MEAYSNGNKKKRRPAVAVLAVLLVLLLIVAGVVIYIFSLAGEMEYNPVQPAKVERIDKDVLNVLLIGLDVREEGSDDGRNDLTMVLSLDYKNKKVKAASILRDSYVSIPEHGKGRINTSWRSGGPALAIDTVNKNFGLDIQRYVKVDFYGLANIIDAVGGITIAKLSKEEAVQVKKYCLKKTKIAAGKNLKLNGAEAVAYGRIRKMDSDFNRTDRQREVFGLLVDRVLSMDKTDLMAKSGDILKNLETNFTKGELIDTALGLLSAGFDKDIADMHVPVAGSYKDARIDGDAVLQIDIPENKAALKEFIYGK